MLTLIGYIDLVSHFLVGEKVFVNFFLERKKYKKIYPDLNTICDDFIHYVIEKASRSIFYTHQRYLKIESANFYCFSVCALSKKLIIALSLLKLELFLAYFELWACLLTDYIDQQ